jgi:dihydroflavonol-4-reductase
VVGNYLLGRLPGVVEGSTNVVDVRDVAEGHVRAAERGRPGERYILGHANVTLPEFFQLLEQVSGIKAPRVRIPYGVAYLSACVSEAVARTITHRPPFATLAGVRLSRKRMFYDSSKAVRELGFPQTPVIEACRKAVRWFREHGYAP